MKKIILICILFLATITYSQAQENTIWTYITQSESENMENFNIPYNAIECMDYDRYLNFADYKFITLLPIKEAFQSFVDPVSYGTTSQNIWEFNYDKSKVRAQSIYADVYKCTFDGLNWVKDGDVLHQVMNQSISTLSTAIHDRMEFILKNCITTEPYQQGKKFYKTMGNSYVKIENGGKTVAGPYQQNHGQSIHAQSVNETDNGLCIVVPTIPATSENSVAATLAQHSEFSEFLSILKNCGALNTTDSKDNWTAADYTNGNLLNIKTYGEIGAEDKPSTSTSTKKATYLLSNGDYTLYVPTNDAMQKAYAAGLPNLNDLAAAEAYDEEHEAERSDSVSLIREVMLDFVKYHIQDNSVFVDGGFESGRYKTAKHKVIETSTGKYKVGQSYKLNVNVSSSAMTITDAMGNTRKVISKDGLYNIMANEYWISSTGSAGWSGKIMSTNADPYSYYLDNSSFVVIHAIDGPLFYDSPNQFKYTYHPLVSE